MQKKTLLKKLLILICLSWLSINGALAQTGNPSWNLAPNYWANPPYAPLPTNSYTWNPGSGVVQPGYGYSGPSGIYGTQMLDATGISTINGTNNMYVDNNNNLLFSVVSGYIFNQHGYLVDTLKDTITLLGSGGLPTSPYQVVIQGFSDVCVAPNPANCEQYYLFTAMPIPGGSNAQGIFSGNEGAYYDYNHCQSPRQYSEVKPYFTLIDVSQSGPYMPSTERGKNMKASIGVTSTATAADLYKATATPSNGLGCKPAYCDIHYATTKLYSKGSSSPYRLLFVLNNAQLITYKIDGKTVGTNSTGVHYVRTVDLDSLTSSSLGNVSSYVNVTELELYEDSVNHKIKVACAVPNDAGFSVNNNPLLLVDYDTIGTCKSGTAHTLYTSASYTTTMLVRGIEFSPNGNYVYVVHDSTGNYPSTVDQVTYSTPATTYTLSTHPSYMYSQVEKGTDGNLYLIASTGTTSPVMAKISSPNTATPVLTNSVLTLSSYNRYNVGNSNSSPSVYLLPDQIDQEVNADFLISPTLKCCLLTEPYDQFKYYAGTTTTTWTTTATTQTWSANTGTTTATCKNPLALQTNTTSTVTIGEELRIPAGYTVTISKMTLKFSPQARLIIENAYSSKNGGRLVLDSCTLTVDNNCITDMWPGIQVWGDPTSSQLPAHQGWLYTKNNTVIENAYVGIYVGYDSSWLSQITPRPPLVATTTFSASIDSGQGGGIIQCENTTFLNNQRHVVFLDFAQGGSSFQHFNLCTFNINAALLTSGLKPKAMVSLYNYTPGTYKLPFSGCSFIDTHNNYTLTGLWSSNSSYWVDKYTVSGNVRSTFNNLLYGVYSKNTVGNSATIQVNNSTLTSNKVGIYLGNITNATVTNDTTKIYGAVGGGNCSGLYLDNCTGYKVEGNNYTKNGSTSNNKYGILVYNSGAYVNCIYNNTFDNIYKGSQAQYRNYASAGHPLPQNYLGLEYICNKFNTISGADIYVPARGSSANVGATYSGTDTAGIAFNQGTQSAGYPQVGGNLFSHTTGGSDYYIETTAGHAIGCNYIYYCGTGSCTGASNYPYNNVSSYVSVASYSVADINCSTDPYSNGLRMANPLEVMLSNAATAKTTCDSLQATMSSLAPNDTNLFNLGQTFSNTRTLRHRLLNEAIHYYLDNPDDSTDIKINALMKEKALELPARAKLETALYIHDSAFATSALTEVANQEGQSNYVTLHTILLQNLSKTPEQIMKNQSIVSQLRAMATDSSDHTAYLKAHILLSTIGLSNYKLLYQESLADSSNNNERKAQQTIVQSLSLSTLQNSPNPFKESTTVKANVVEKTDNAYIVIMDMVGNEVARYQVQQGENNITINASNLNQSVMFCTLVIDGKRVKTNKMVLIK